MGEWIYWLDAIGHEDLPRVGGKGANLGEMFGAGLPVPSAFCVSTDAYRVQCESASFREAFAAIREEHANDLERMSEAIGELFGQTAMDVRVREAICEAYERLGEGVRVAVRSSATAEDLPDASFAGQQETFLGVVGEEALLEAVKACWASLWGARAIHYRERQGYAHEAVALSVVVQEMVAADVAGVMFTANPLTSSRDELVITSSFGLGESVVSGLVTPDTFQVGKEPLVLRHKEIARKEVQVVQVAQGSEEVEVEAARQTEPSMTDAQVLEVARMGLAVEAHYGAPQDIEWALVGGAVFLLQSRPITTLQEVAVEVTLPTIEEGVYGWIDFRHITPGFLRKQVMEKLAEPVLLDHFPEPLRPLDFSLCLRNIFGEVARLGRDLGLPPKLDSVVREDPSGLFLFHYPFPSFGTLLLRWPLVLWRMRKYLRYVPLHEWEEVDLPYLEEQLAPLDEEVAGLAGAALLANAKERMARVKELAYRRFSKYSPVGSMVHKRLQKILKTADPARADEWERKLLLTLPYKTAVINDALKAMVRTFAASVSVKEALCQAPHGRQHDALLQAADNEESLAAFASFMAAHGCRTSVGMEPLVSYASWRDAPEDVLSTASAMLSSPASYEDTSEQARIDYEESRASVLQLLASDKKRRIFEETLELYRGFWIAREGSLYTFEEQTQAARDAVRRFAAEMVACGRLQSEADAFYLTIEELEELATSEDPDVHEVFNALCKRRKGVWEVMCKQLKGRFSSSQVAEGSVYKGTGASPGRARGVVRVVAGPHEFGKLGPGDVLVCHVTNPAWTPLFAVASAVVTDTGGMLSHAAIVAREYGIPAVMGCTGVTEMLQDGWTVEVDGSCGEVRKLEAQT